MGFELPPNRVSRRALLQAGGGAGVVTALAGAGLIGLTPAEQALAAPGGAVKLNVLFIGAHPDDEASTLATMGQWNEYLKMKVGVITITRGEGGGNAVGLDEGPPLGMIREAEERTATSLAGVANIFNLDGLDFYYTASAPLSDQVWGGEEVLNRIVRVVRATRPEVIVTMNPSAVEGNHGNHQKAAMYAVEAYLAAGDASRFPEHLQEGFGVWQPRRLLRAGANGTGKAGPSGVADGYIPAVASDVVFGTWNGTESQRHGARWSAVLDKMRWAYVTQGWAEFAPGPTAPEQIANAWYTVIHTRAPIVDPKSGGDAALRGAVLPIAGGLPLGTMIDVRPDRFEAVASEPVSVAVTVTAPERGLGESELVLGVPQGWAVSEPRKIPRLKAGASHRVTFDVTAADAEPGTQVRVEAVLTTGSMSGRTFAQMRVAGAVEATIEPLEEIQDFREWTSELGMKHLDVLVPELFAVGQGRTRVLNINVTNYSTASRSGSVAVSAPSGFQVSPESLSYNDLASGATITESFDLTNADTSLPTANRAENRGSWPVTVSAESDRGSAVRNVVMNLVPSHTAQGVAVAPTIDGVRSAGEYPNEAIPIDTVWDGSPMGGTSASISGQAWLTFDDSNLYVFVSVKDDIRGTILPPEDNKRQRRTDSVEIYVDPRGTAPNTAHTLIAGIMPSMGSMTGAPGVGRDRDNWQGDAAVTAPGMEVAVVMADSEADYTGYDLEVKIPFAVLPDHIDPSHMGFNVVINDSDTQNKAAQTRVGWSTFPGMRADPWRWGLVSLVGMATGESSPKEPTLPDTAARSVESPQSIIQSAADKVPLGGHSPSRRSLRILSTKVSQGTVSIAVNSPSPGTLRAYLWDGTKVLGSASVAARSGKTTLTFPADTAKSNRKGSLQASPDNPVVAVSYDGSLGVAAAAAPLGGSSR